MFFVCINSCKYNFNVIVYGHDITLYIFVICYNTLPVMLTVNHVSPCALPFDTNVAISTSTAQTFGASFKLSSQDALTTTHYSQTWWKTCVGVAHYFLSVNVGAAHWASHYVIEQSELPIGSPWSDSTMSLKVSGISCQLSYPFAARGQIL